MRSIHRVATMAAALLIAACSSGSTTQGATAAAATCAESTGTTVVATTVADFTWSQPLTAKVGDVITWTNGGSVPHRFVLDNGTCSMPANIPGGGSKSLVFSVAGTFPFHCGVHSSMKGTITIT